MGRLMGLQMALALALDDVLPTQTIGSAFVGNGVPGGRPFGRGECIIYPYAEFADFGETLDPPVGWPSVSALIIESSTGTIICRAGQLLVKGYSAEDYRLVLNLTGWDWRGNLDLPACESVIDPVFPMSEELAAIAIRNEGDDAWRNPQTGQVIDTSLAGEYLLLECHGALEDLLAVRTAGY